MDRSLFGSEESGWGKKYPKWMEVLWEVGNQSPNNHRQHYQVRL